MAESGGGDVVGEMVGQTGEIIGLEREGKSESWIICRHLKRDVRKEYAS